MSKNTKSLLAALLLLTVGITNTMAQSLKIEPLANDNYLIRVARNATERYIILPIEETAPESQVNVIVDNTQHSFLKIRLALTHVDYYVPFCLDKYRGRNLVLFTHVNIDRSNRGGVGSEICLQDIKLADTFDVTNREKYRPEYHHTPVYGWMNDPNGMFYKDGVWHLYYQYNPYGSMWGNMHWGHSVSKDLIHWQHKPLALTPDAHGAIFSGSCVVDHANTAGFGKGAIIALYTSANDVQSQSLAYSLDDGETFNIYEGNPILTADIPDFRDPNMFWHEATKRWILIMSAGQEMRIYSSPNLKEWTEESRFGREFGCHSGVWECPDLLQLNISDRKSKVRSKWVLICNINPGSPSGGSGTQYFVGNFDGHKFTLDNPKRYTSGKSLWQDYGKDHYATVSFSNAPDSRHTMIGWMSNWQYANQVPTKQYRSANTICREPFLYYGADKQIYLGSRPSPEYDGKGYDQTIKVKGSCTVTLSNNEGEEFKIIYDEKSMTLTTDRSGSGEKAFSQDFDQISIAPVRNRLSTMRIFIDNSSVEVFGNDGEVAITNLVFPKSKYNNLNVSKQ